MSKEQKIDNTFNRVMDDINRLQKAFQPQKNLEKAIAEVGGDISWLKDINEAFDNLYDKLEEGHMGAVAHLQMEESAKKEAESKEKDLDGKFTEVLRVKEKYELENYEKIYAYGDSRGDKELLEFADYSDFKPFA